MSSSHFPTDASSALALITGAAYTAAHFRQDWPVLVAAVRHAPPANRMQWVMGLERLAGLIVLQPDSLELQGGLARLAAVAGYPGLTLDCLQRLDVKGGLSDQDLLLMIEVCLTTGDTDRAARVAATLRRQGLRTPGLVQLQDRIDQRLSDSQQPWRQPFAFGPQMLLDPLQPDHADALARQYRDPATALLTGLPEIGADLTAEQWIERRLQDSPATYAWVHRRLGLVGYGDLYLHRQAGYLCMWVGTDFRGQGLGRSVVRALCQMAFRRGLDLVLSSAYENNQRSIRSLQANQFIPIPVRAEEPDHERRFFSLSTTPITPTRARRRLVEFCDLTHTGVRFRPGWFAPEPAPIPLTTDKELSWPST